MRRLSKSINETPAQKAAKRRKLSEEAQEAGGKRLEIVQDEDDDVFVEATPLAQKTRWTSSSLEESKDCPWSSKVEMRCLFSRFTLDQMLNAVRLKVEEQSEMSLEMLRFLERKRNNISRSIPHSHGLISVQASSVASESAFSTSGRVLSIRRTRLTSASLEMCMCSKDQLDAKERKQDKCPLEIPLDFEEDVFDDEVQRNEAIPLSDEEIALDASSEGTLSPERPQYDFMMSSEAEDDY
nr:zinc finger BED domain-containing protein RICESLEEPER 2 [Tanacetum cinerariifolium]